MTKQAPAYSDFLAPRFWPTWLGIGLLCLAALMPFRIRIALGSTFGWLTWCIGFERRYITAVNIGICFPELDERAQAALVKAAFREVGIGLVETACGWIRSPARFASICELRGSATLQHALDQGKGVLLLGGHYSTLDFAANILSFHFPFGTTYRPHKNPLFDAFMLRGRLRNCNGVFDRKDIRGAFRHLKQGKILWYAPDQDYGPELAVYAPFFGRKAATITAGSRFAAIKNSPVFHVRHHRDTKAGRYVVEVIALPTYPTGDDVTDANLINQQVEACIRIAPAQYLWMHKRFKTNPAGKPQSPYIHISTPDRKLGQALFEELTAGSSPIAEYPERLQLQSGLQLRQWPGLAKGYWQRKHPALQLDMISKHLRSHDIATVTVDSLFRLPSQHSTAATCFVPAGTNVARLPPGSVSPEVAADLLRKLHACGCCFRQLQAANFLYVDSLLAIDDPLQLQRRPGTASYQDCARDIDSLCREFALQGEQQQLLYATYMKNLRPSDSRAITSLLAAVKASGDNAYDPASESPVA